MTPPSVVCFVAAPHDDCMGTRASVSGFFFRLKKKKEDETEETRVTRDHIEGFTTKCSRYEKQQQQKKMYKHANKK